MRLLLVLLAALVGSAELTTSCTLSPVSRPDPNALCSATLDVVLVVDASSSVADIHLEVNQFIHALRSRFAFTSSGGGPRFAVVTFNGPPMSHLQDFDEAEAARLLMNLTGDTGRMHGAIDGRPASSGTTCISCGLLRAHQHLAAFGRPTARPVVVVLTDGSQTVGGDDLTVIEYAANLKATGNTVVTVGFGDALQTVMEQMASAPAALYAIDAYGQNSTPTTVSNARHANSVHGHALTRTRASRPPPLACPPRSHTGHRPDPLAHIRAVH